MRNKIKIVVTCANIVELSAPDHIGVKQGLDWLGIDYKIIDSLKYEPSEMVQQILDYKPDLIVYYMDNNLRAGIPLQIKNKFTCKQVFWEMDYRPLKHNIEQSYDGLFQEYKESVSCLDHIFLSNKGQLKDWENFFKVPTSYLPHGCYVLDKPEFSNEFQYPCVFIGAMNNDEMFNSRKILIEEIAKLIDIKFINESDRDKRNEVWTNMPKIYHSSDTILDVSHFWKNPGYASGRYFYTAGLGGCSITKRFPDCEELYPEGIKIYFDEPEEAVEKIKYYQTHKEEREKVKLAAFEYNKVNHNFKIRFEDILKKLDL